MKKRNLHNYFVIVIAFLFVLTVLSHVTPSTNQNINNTMYAAQSQVQCNPEKEIFLQCHTVIQGDGETNYWAVICGWGGNPHQVICVDHEIRMLTRTLWGYGWEKNHVYILQNEEAKKDAVLASFSWLNEMGVDEDDVVFVFLSFHGYHKEDQPPFDEPNHMDGFLVPFDFEFEIEENGILDDELGDALDTLKSKNIVAIVESCHSGEMIDGTQDLCGDGRVVLTSCLENEASYFLYLRLSGLFPFYVIKGLTGRADTNHDGWVSAEEVFQFAEQRTIYRSHICSILMGMEPDSQYPQIYDGWPSEEHNDEELKLINCHQLENKILN